MNRTPSVARLALAALVAVASIGAAADNAAAQSPAAAAKAAAFSPPRLSDGTPDFRGIWQAHSLAYVDLEGPGPMHSAKTGTKSVVVDPPDGKIPYLPDALKQRNANFKSRSTADPASNCYQAGVPRAVLLPAPFQIVQSVGNLAIVYTDNHAYRVVDPQSVPHDDGIDFFMGDSRGHWEGDTLVVDVIDLGDQTWLDEAGNFHSDQLHVVERYTLTGPNTISYEATLDDPKTFSQPWTIRTTLYRDSDPGARIIEDECLEGADGRWHHLSPFDPKALLHHDYAAELAAEAKAQAEAGAGKP
jgi:hypothetical protein